MSTKWSRKRDFFYRDSLVAQVQVQINKKIYGLQRQYVENKKMRHWIAQSIQVHHYTHIHIRSFHFFTDHRILARLLIFHGERKMDSRREVRYRDDANKTGSSEDDMKFDRDVAGFDLERGKSPRTVVLDRARRIKDCCRNSTGYVPRPM